MTVSISYVITDSGDGSNGMHWVRDPAVIEKMEKLAEDGDETYASGDGLQIRTLNFPEDFNLDEWVKRNHLYVVEISEFE